MNILSKLIISGIVFVPTVAFGLLLSRSGRPYNSLLFNIHKLIALAAVIITVVQLVRMFGSTELLVLSSVLLVLARLGVVALFVSGALMSAGKLDHVLLHTVHRVALAVLVISLPSAFFLL